MAPAALLAIALAALAQGQQIPFQLLLTQGKNAITIQNGATINFNAETGQTQTASLMATFNGSGQAVISAAPAVIGSTAFTATIAGAPLTLNPGESVTMALQFAPTSATQSSAFISLGFTQSVPGTGTNPPTVTTGAISASALGTAPQFVESYILQSDQNVVPLQPGGTVAFPPTLINTTAQAAFSVTNTGSGAGTIASISIAGGAFHLTNVPLLPATIPAGQSLQVLILYKPATLNSDTGQLTVTFGSGSPLTFNLQGSGSSSTFTYQVLTNPPVTVKPGGTISLPGTNIGQTSSVAIQVFNSGNASGAVNLINLSGGQGFQLSGVPPLPQTLAPNAGLTFTVTFAPAQPGVLTGTLIINSDVLNLSGAGLGPQLQFSYSAGGTTITLNSTNSSVFFSPVQITQSAQLNLDVKNTGTQAATISNIGVGQNNSPFSLTGLPSLPASLAPGADFQLAITFTPVVLGVSNGTLLLDNVTIGLVGSGTQPPPLPTYTISGLSGTAAPASQPSVSLTLASPYPVALAGTLTLSVVGNPSTDPSVQFATGGRTINFTIPANGTNAIFGSQGTQIGFQTGTVASTITLTPAFTTQAGNVDLTPSPPVALQSTIAAAAPTLVAIQLLNQAATGFTIQVTGFSTTRALKTWTVQFATAPGFTMPTSQFSIDVQSVSKVWFGSAASQNFGGQFTLSVPFTFQMSGSGAQNPLKSLASVSVTMSNDVGASNSVTATVQ
jgi:hypothetical protein